MKGALLTACIVEMVICLVALLTTVVPLRRKVWMAYLLASMGVTYFVATQL